MDDVPSIHFQFAFFDGEGKQVKRTRRGRVFDHPFPVELGVVAGADEFLCGLIPRNGSAEMCAAVIHSQKPTIFCSYNVKATVGDVGHGVRWEIVHFTWDDDGAELAFGKPRLQIGYENACSFEGSNATEEHPRDFKEVTAGDGIGSSCFSHGLFPISSNWWFRLLALNHQGLMYNNWHVPWKVEIHSGAAEEDADNSKDNKSGEDKRCDEEHSFFCIRIERVVDPTIKQDNGE